MSLPNPIKNPLVETINIEDLNIRENNPNEMTDETFESLEYSIETFDYLRPILVNQDNIIIDGAQRYQALKKLGMKDIVVVRKHTKNMEELRLLSQAMNKIHGEHDKAKDITELEILMGYNPIELQSLLSFDETGLDLLRQQLAQEEEEEEKEQVEFEAARYPTRKELLNREVHQTKCPSCGHIF